MTSTPDQPPWRAIVGTARGAAHVARGLANQDSAESQVIDAVRGTVVAVADGHGHDRHFRSASGSRLATKTACAVVARLADDGTGQPLTAELADALCDELPEAIVTEWRAAVTRDIAARPYTADELATLERAADGPEIPYGSTLLVALVAGDWLVCAQIGDGDLVGIRPDGQAWSPVAGDALLDGHRTTSLCQSGAVASFRTAVHDLRSQPLLALLLGTDGYGNAQIRDSWQPKVAGDIAELAVGHDGGWFAEQLPAWAERCASADGSGDDTTITLLLAPDSQRRAAAGAALRRELAAAPTVPAALPWSPPPGSPPPATPPPAQSSSSPEAEPWPSPEAKPPPFPDAPPVPGPLPVPGLLPAADAPFGRPSRVTVPGQGRHAARPSSGRRRRFAIAGIGVVVAAGAITAAIVLSQSSGSGHPAGPPPTGHPAPKATASATATSGAPARRSTATPTAAGPSALPSSATPSKAPTRAKGTSGATTAGQPTQNQEG